jgi:hypothetical protein
MPGGWEAGMRERQKTALPLAVPGFKVPVFINDARKGNFS